MTRACRLALLAGLFAACQEPLRIPYVPPELANWPQPYRGVAGLRLHAFETGWIRVHPVIGGIGGSNDTGIPALAFLLDHPHQGPVLIDTGLSPRAASDPDTYPGGLRRVLFEPDLTEDHALVEQLRSAGLSPEIETVILTTCRFPHTGGLRAFAHAVVVTTRAEHRAALASGWLTAYVAEDFAAVTRWRLIDLPADSPLGTFQSHLDLFEDGSVLLLDAAGVTPGGLAVLVRLPEQPVILAGDLAPQMRTLRTTAAPRLLADRRTWWDNLWRLKRFAELAPGLRVIAGHDTESLTTIAGLEYHPPPPPEERPEKRPRADRPPEDRGFRPRMPPF